MPRILIIGYGNPLRGDDGVGFLAAERLRELVRDPEILALHQLTPELMEVSSRADCVIFIDAAADGEPGTIRRRRVGLAFSGAASFTHQATPAAILAGARTLFGHAPRGWLYTVAGANFGLTDKLSPSVAEALERLVARMVRIAGTNRCPGEVAVKSCTSIDA